MKKLYPVAICTRSISSLVLAWRSDRKQFEFQRRVQSLRTRRPLHTIRGITATRPNRLAKRLSLLRGRSLRQSKAILPVG